MTGGAEMCPGCEDCVRKMHQREIRMLICPDCGAWFMRPDAEAVKRFRRFADIFGAPVAKAR